MSIIKLVILIILFLIIILLIKNKSKLTNVNQEIIISLTTSPKRINKLENLFNTLSNQTIKPLKIVLNLVHVFKRNNTLFDKIPDFILNNELVQINRCEDIGPSTKILPTVWLFKDNPETIIISVDDDIEYKNNLVELLLNYSNKYPDCVITGESFMRLKDNYAELVEGYSSVLYKQKFLNGLNQQEVLNYPKYCYLADDFILSNYLRKNNTKIVVLDNNKPYSNIYLDYGNDEDALRNGAHGESVNNMDNYKKCNNYLKKIDNLYINYFEKNL